MDNCSWRETLFSRVTLRVTGDRLCCERRAWRGWRWYVRLTGLRDTFDVVTQRNWNGYVAAAPFAPLGLTVLALAIFDPSEYMWVAILGGCIGLFFIALAATLISYSWQHSGKFLIVCEEYDDNVTHTVARVPFSPARQRQLEELAELIRAEYARCKNDEFPDASLPAELGQLAALHRQGVLTEEEFRAAKARRLAGPLPEPVQPV